MFIRSPSQRDAEDWVRCFAQIYEEEIEDSEEDKGDYTAEELKENDRFRAQTDFIREETPKWAEEANKVFKNSEEWELGPDFVLKKDVWRKKSFVVNASSDTCLEALLDKRGDWDFSLKNYRKISSLDNMRIYHALHKGLNIVLLIQVFLDLPFQILVHIETAPHVYYPSTIHFTEIFSLIPHPFQQNTSLISVLTNTCLFDLSLPSLRIYSEISNFQSAPAEIPSTHPLESPSCNKQATDYSAPLDFDQFFVYGEGGEYERDPTNGGLVFTDQALISKQRGILASMLKKIGRSLLSGQSIMSMSLPVYIFSKHTLLQQIGIIYGYCPVFLEKALRCTGLDRFKYLVALAVSLLHMPTSQRKPFNPILGETFQGRIGKALIFCEQVCHHPPTSAFQILGEGYSLQGCYEFVANTAANSVKARLKGPTLVSVEGNRYSITYPVTNVSGTMIGKRCFNWQGILTVTSPSEFLYCEIAFNPDKKGAISGIFTRSQTPADFFVGSIQRIRSTHPILTEEGMKSMREAGKKSLAKMTEEVEAEIGKVEGYWTMFLDIDKQRFWSFDEYRPYPLASIEDPLPSDSSLRPDLKCMVENNLEEAQVQKDILENIQRRDRKLREDMGKN